MTQAELAEILDILRELQRLGWPVEVWPPSPLVLLDVGLTPQRRAADDRWVVRAEHLPTGIHAESDPSGSALRARAQAIGRLRLMLIEEEA